MYRKQIDAACPTMKTNQNMFTLRYYKKWILFENVNEEPFRVTLRVPAESSGLSQSDAKSELNIR